MSEIRQTIENSMQQAETAAREGLHGNALEKLDAAEEWLNKLPKDENEYAREARVKIFNNRGIVYKNLENFDEGIACFESALRLIEENGERLNPKLKVGVHLNLANLLSRKRQYSSAMRHYQYALNSADDLPGREAVDIKCKIHNNLALFYCNFGEREKAQAELDKCLKYKGGSEFQIDFDKERRAWIRTNLGLIHSELADEKELSEPGTSEVLRRSALGFFREALDIYMEIDYALMQARTLLNIATVERFLGQKKEAVENLIAAKAIADRLRSDRLRITVLEQCVAFHLGFGSSPFANALDELFGSVPRHSDPFSERILRRIEEHARRAGNREILAKVRKKLASFKTENAGSKEEADDTLPR